MRKETDDGSADEELLTRRIWRGYYLFIYFLAGLPVLTKPKEMMTGEFIFIWEKTAGLCWTCSITRSSSRTWAMLWRLFQFYCQKSCHACAHALKVITGSFAFLLSHHIYTGSCLKFNPIATWLLPPSFPFLADLTHIQSNKAVEPERVWAIIQPCLTLISPLCAYKVKVEIMRVPYGFECIMIKSTF